MRRAGFLVCLLVVAALSLAGVAIAQSSDTSGSPPAAHPGGFATNPLQVALTGCLKRSSVTGKFVLADQGGSSWELTSPSIDLAPQLNHSVTVTGKPVSSAPPPNGQQNGAVADTDRPQHVLRVLTLKMLSPSCTR